MAQLIDPLDYEAYMEATESAVNVRPASVYLEALQRELGPQEHRPRAGYMRSTKLADYVAFRPSEVTIWLGYNGHRKTAATGQVGLDLCHAGERVLSASFELPPAKTLARMAQQAAAKEVPDPQWVAQFSRWTDGRFWIFDHRGKISLRHMHGVLRYFAHELGGTHAFIDSIQFVCGSEDMLDPQKQFIEGMVAIAAETSLHLHLVAHCKKPQGGDESKPPGRYELRGFSAITDQADNCIGVWKNQKRKEAVEAGSLDPKILAEPDAIFRVDKQRHGRFEGNLKLWFDDRCFRFTNERLTIPQPYNLGEES